ncbi:MAG: hypothetical protein MZV63_71780 [Marinilabiliales bacterium]|nr:hypothetical protein [Marinilabiliales bacterium]
MKMPPIFHNVSGGTIRIYDATNSGIAKAFDVKSSAANINVAGGTLELMLCDRFGN